MRLSLAVLVLCLACNKPSQSEPTEPAPAPTPAPPPSAAAAEPTPQPTPQPVKPEAPQPRADDAKPIDASKAKKFLAYQEKLLPLVRGAEDAKAKGQPLAEKIEKVRAESGLSESEVLGLSEISAVISVRSDELQQRLDIRASAIEKAMAEMPEREREEAAKALTELRTMQANMFGLTELRAKYGDGVVDAMLKQEADLKRQNAELSELR